MERIDEFPHASTRQRRTEKLGRNGCANRYRIVTVSLTRASFESSIKNRLVRNIRQNDTRPATTFLSYRVGFCYFDRFFFAGTPSVTRPNGRRLWNAVEQRDHLLPGFCCAFLLFYHIDCFVEGLIELNRVLLQLEPDFCCFYRLLLAFLRFQWVIVGHESVYWTVMG